MRKLHDKLVWLSDKIFLVEKWLLLAAVVTAVAVNFANVCLRYLAGKGLSYCETLSVTLFMFMVVIGANIAAKTDSEIKIDIFRFESEKKNAIIRLIPDFITIVTLVLALIGLFATISSVMINKQKVTPLPIYTYHLYIVMTIGFFMILLDRVIISLQRVLIIRGEEAGKGARTS